MATDGHGYGVLTFRGRIYKAHRFSWSLVNGPLSLDEWVLHRCDMTGCVNPEHLFIGNQDDNMKDAVSKGRMRQGEAHYLSVLTEDDVRLIRASNESQRNLAIRYNVNPSTISLVKAGKTWKGII